MIKRDKYGIICQHNFEAPDQPFDTEAQGDSAARTGPMAAAGSEIDMQLVSKFVLPNGKLVRHPFDKKWSDPSLTSRDQLVQYCVYRGSAAIKTARYYLELGRVNKDWLSPSVRLHLHKVALKKPSLALKVIGELNMWADLIWNTKVKPDEELNQFVCMAIVMGPAWSARLLKMHPDLQANMVNYWNGWRNQPEVGEALLSLLKKEAEKAS